jgi:signal transduction histidine kinase
MNRAKNEIVASIARAQLELDDALEDLKSLPAVDPMVLGFVSHALRNYLQVTAGTTGLLREALKDHPDKEIGIWLEGLKNVTARMLNLVEVMRSGPRKMPPQMRFEKIDLATLVGRACDFYRRPAARKQIELLFEKPPTPLPKVRTDRIAVAAILDNLLSNAVKFSPAGKWVSVDLQPDADSVVCRVRDQGPGISPRDRASLFQRGAQLQAKPTGGESSTGFGLAVAAELVAHLGGEIGCESEPGKGACFFFRLPCSRRRKSKTYEIEL